MNRMEVCFVCGSYGAEWDIYTKPRNKGSYFAFLEHHDPPQGCSKPNKDGIVKSCNLCYAFLNQQWDSFEKTNTPMVKRLYWLKRADDGQFTGAEMRLQGEYAAQVLGLQYHPNVYDGRMQPGLGQPMIPVSPSGSMQMISPQPAAQQPRPSGYPGGRELTGALDLTVGRPAPKEKKATLPQEQHKSRSQRSEPESKKIACYVCGVHNQDSSMVYVSSAKQSEGDPFYPFLAHIQPPKGAEPLTRQAYAKVCSGCRKSLLIQWKTHEARGTSILQRLYRINENSYGESAPSSKPEKSEPDTRPEVCYLCANEFQRDTMKILYTKPPTGDSRHSMFFPFVAALQRPRGATNVDLEGRVRSCRTCYSGLQRQWEMYEAQKVSHTHRQYQLRPITNDQNEQPMKSLLNIPKPGAILKSGPAAGSPSLNQPLNIKIRSSSPATVLSSPAQGLLAIAPPVPLPSTVPTHLPRDLPPRPLDLPPRSLDLPQRSIDLAPRSLHQTLNVPINIKKEKDDICIKPDPVVTTAVQDSSSALRICYICGSKCSGGRHYILSCYPAKSETGTSSPFFPFLANRDPAPNAEKMTAAGTAYACRYCYFNLLRQWSDFEASQDPAHSNRWVRRYNIKDYTCYLCVKVTSRKYVRTISIRRYPFLRNLSQPPNGIIVITDSESVVVCADCDKSLASQFAKFDQQGTPLDQRRYQLPSGKALDESLDPEVSKPLKLLSNLSDIPSNNDHDTNQDSYPSNKEHKPTSNNGSCDGDTRNHDNQDFIDVEGDEGLPPSSKPPPLTAMNSNGKPQRTTATVPPLNQISPGSSLGSNNSAMQATRNSSFSARLRNLAKQAVEPADAREAAARERDVSPQGSTTSPRESTPKRGPPPLVYNSHSQSSSSITSPPVVTIAPTPSHNSLSLSHDRKALERSSVISRHSSSSSITDRDHKTHSVSPREEERARETTPKGPTPFSISSLATPSSSTREDPMFRGFQPYRPGEEFRPPTFPHPYALDPAALAYHQALMAQQALQHQAAFSDPLLLERYRMMAPPFMPYSHPGFLPPTGLFPMHPSAAAAYPPELLRQQLAMMSPGLLPPTEHRSPGASTVERPRSREELRREDREHSERMRETERTREYERDRERRNSLLLREAEHERDRETISRETRQSPIHHSPRASKYEELARTSKYEELARTSKYEELARTSKYEDLPRNSKYEELPRTSKYEELPRTSKYEELPLAQQGSITQGTPFDYRVPNHHKETGIMRKIEEEARIQEQQRLASKMNRDEKKYENRDSDKRSQEHSSSSLAKDLSLGNRNHTDNRDIYSLHSSILSSKPENNHKLTSVNSEFYRPFEKGLKNGYDEKGLMEYERRLMNEKILAEDRALYNHARLLHNHVDSVKHPSQLDIPKSEISRSHKDKHTEGLGLLKHQRAHHADAQIKRPPSDTERPLLNNMISAQPYISGYPLKPYKHTDVKPTDLRYNEPASIDASIRGLPKRAPSSQEYDKMLSAEAPSQPGVSKLDLQEKEIREARLNGTYVSDDENCSDTDSIISEGEKKRQKLLLVASGPPMKLEKSPQKLKLFNSIGLATQAKKRDIEFQHKRKRRKIYREPSVSPVELAEPEEPPMSPLTSSYTPDELNWETDVHYKRSYLAMLGLRQVSSDERKVLGELQEACLEERRRRLGLHPVEKAPAHNSTKQKDEKPVIGTKRKVDGESATEESLQKKQISLAQLQKRHLEVQRAQQQQSHAHSNHSHPHGNQQQLHSNHSIPQSNQSQSYNNRPGISSDLSKGDGKQSQAPSNHTYPYNNQLLPSQSKQSRPTSNPSHNNHNISNNSSRATTSAPSHSSNQNHLHSNSVSHRSNSESSSPHSNHSQGKLENRAVIFPESREKNRVMPRDFAQEFHESVLQSTRLQIANSQSDKRRTDPVRYSLEQLPRYTHTRETTPNKTDIPSTPDLYSHYSKETILKEYRESLIRENRYNRDSFKKETNDLYKPKYRDIEMNNYSSRDHSRIKSPRDEIAVNHVKPETSRNFPESHKAGLESHRNTFESQRSLGDERQNANDVRNNHESHRSPLDLHRSPLDPRSAGENSRNVGENSRTARENSRTAVENSRQQLDSNAKYILNSAHSQLQRDREELMRRNREKEQAYLNQLSKDHYKLTVADKSDLYKEYYRNHEALNDLHRSIPKSSLGSIDPLRSKESSHSQDLRPPMLTRDSYSNHHVEPKPDALRDVKKEMAVHPAAMHPAIDPYRRGDAPLYDNSAAMRWPGIEVLMEAYNRQQARESSSSEVPSELNNNDKKC
ncbi:unnamed protein product [Owenia fusiformis]|uniref:Genetic suppressor element-like domain-containing protein n=1 Tax=Owenia fusiformis TaxID=6347 RepID=A0A8S4NHE0_OWEFU|nr:unnamed protein product [Owenia fusiformis]